MMDDMDGFDGAKAYEELLQEEHNAIVEIRDKRREDRLWLAGMAMQALIAQGGSDVWRMAYQSFDMADAMLEVADGQA